MSSDCTQQFSSSIGWEHLTNIVFNHLHELIHDESGEAITIVRNCMLLMLACIIPLFIKILNRGIFTIERLVKTGLSQVLWEEARLLPSHLVTLKS